MKILLSQCAKIYIECKMPKINGYLKDIFFNTLNGRISYITILDKNTNDIYKVSINDIIIWDKNKIFIREIFTKITNTNSVNIKNITVINNNNKIIGKVNDFMFDTVLNILNKIYVNGSWYNFWRKYIFDRINIIKITPNFIQVNDKNVIKNNKELINTFTYDT